MPLTIQHLSCLMGYLRILPITGHGLGLLALGCSAMHP